MPEPTITLYRDGPYLVRGPFRLTDQEGNEIDVGRRTVALCRCGKSRIRPFCDGTHKAIGFTAPTGAEEPQRAGLARPGDDGARASMSPDEG